MMKTLVKILKISFSFIFLICTLLSSAGCNASSGSAWDFYYFNTEIHVQSQDKPLTNQLITQIDQILSSVQSTFDVELEDSITHRFNQAEQGFVKVNDDFITVLESCQKTYDFSEGRFNPALFTLTKLWGFGKEYPVANFSPPTTEQINTIITSGALEFEDVDIDKPNKRVFKPNSNLQLDLGGIAKGFACDRVVELLKQNGYLNGYVSMGGSSLRLLNMDSLFVTHPRKHDNVLQIDCTRYQDLSLSTSGDYQRYYEYNGNRYSHILSPTTGSPAKGGVISATILGVDAMTADALTTAICAYENQTGVDTLDVFLNKIISTHTGCSVYVFCENENSYTLLTNKEKGEDFTLYDNTFEIIKV